MEEGDCAHGGSLRRGYDSALPGWPMVFLHHHHRAFHGNVSLLGGQPGRAMAFASEESNFQFREEQPFGRTLVLSKWPALAAHSGLLGSIRLWNHHERSHSVDQHGVRGTARGFYWTIVAERVAGDPHIELQRTV